MKAWYWQYPRADHDAAGQAAPSGLRSKAAASVRSGRIRTSVFGDRTYFHCPDCPRAYYTAEAARGCCGAEREKKRYLGYLAKSRELYRFRVKLDTVQ